MTLLETLARGSGAIASYAAVGVLLVSACLGILLARYRRVEQ